MSSPTAPCVLPKAEMSALYTARCLNDWTEIHKHYFGVKTNRGVGV